MAGGGALTGEARRPKFTDVFVERPVVSVVIALALLLIGLRAAIELPVLQYPRIESSTLEITTPYVGASAETVQGFITDLVERAAATIPGIDYIESRTTPGRSDVTVFLDSRSEVYGDALLRTALDMKSRPALARAAIDEHGVDLVLVAAAAPGSRPADRARSEAAEAEGRR